MFTLKLFKLLRAFDKNDFSAVNKLLSNNILGVRIAQLYSTRIDILSKEMCYFLSTIHSSRVEIPPKSMLKILDKEENPLSILEFYDNEPYRISYLYQIYTGTLKNGKDVVIKFTNNNNKQHFLKQLSTLEESSKVIAFISPKLNKKFALSGFLNILKEASLSKADLLAEINFTRQLKKYKANYLEKYNLNGLHFSNFLYEYSTSSYLISEYRRTHSVLNLIEDKKMKVKYTDDIFKYHFFYIFIIGKYHSDIHPGNILIDDDNGEVIFIDTNSLSEISDNFRINFFYFLLYLSEGDISLALKHFSLSLIKQLSAMEEEMLYEDFSQIFSSINNKTVQQINFSQELMKFAQIGTSKGITLSEDFFSILKVLIRFEDISSETLSTGIFTVELNRALTIFREDDRLNLALCGQ